MENIKFRVWDNVDYMSKPFTLLDVQRRLTQFTHDCHVMQYTGLQDKKGNDIYEDDICTVAGIGLAIVETCPYNGTQFKTLDGYDVPVIDCVAEDDDFEIVGNIHQNPELLSSAIDREVAR